MLHRCCRARRIRAESPGGLVEVAVEERVTRYNVEGVVDPLPEAIRGRASLEVDLVCATACLSSSMGGPGEALRRAVGPTAYIRYRRSGGIEELRVDGLEAVLVLEEGRLKLRGIGARLEQALEKCLLKGAAIVAPRLEEMLREGIEVGEYRVYELGGYLESLIANPLARDALQAVEPRSGCIEDVVSEAILRGLAPLAAAATALHDYIRRSIVAYPVHGDAILDVHNSLGDYGVGLGAVLVKSPREASIIASKLTGLSIDVKTISIDGFSVPLVRVESGVIAKPENAPLVTLALSIAASVVAKRSIIIAVDAPVERLSRSALLRELEKVNAVLLYSRL